MPEYIERNDSVQNGSKISCKQEAYPCLRGTVPYRTVSKFPCKRGLILMHQAGTWKTFPGEGDEVGQCKHFWRGESLIILHESPGY